MTTDPTHGGHPTDLDLAAWSDEPRSARADVGPHVAGCERCRAELRALTAARAALTLDPPLPTAEAFAAQRERIRAAVAAAPRREGWRAGRIAWLAPLAAAAAIAAFVLVDRARGPESRDPGDTSPATVAAGMVLPVVADAAAAAEQAAGAIAAADDSAAEVTVVLAEAIDEELLDAALAAAEPLAPPIAVERSLTTELLFAELPADEQSAVLMEMASADLDF